MMNCGDTAGFRKGEDARGLWCGEGAHRGEEKKWVCLVGVRDGSAIRPRLGTFKGEVG
jgi:hypothetical protein